ncbi:hypothetical protein T11_3479 [Trichinella zimbabwensis]|uniref:HAT C-terminal dimerisation domain-containing protein n=1 Tax=Trichinella zimbabwensis TaxID=268475 RepID=A0A0V1H0V6_9BILA|nr:hypothetical protein T11_3479 [Trichinella zimbabwensis]
MSLSFVPKSARFLQLKALIDSKEIRPDDIPTNSFSGVIDVLLKEFSERFKDFEKISVALRLVAFPHLVATESAPLDLQMELLRELARNILVLFGSICMCEAAFSRMKYLKHQNGAREKMFTKSRIGYQWTVGLGSLAAVMTLRMLNAASSSQKVAHPWRRRSSIRKSQRLCF